jgi:HD-like signal output (HDOD) protein
MVAAELQQSEKFALVQMLAKDLSKGGLELPSFPDIVIRTRRALADDNVTTEQIVQIIGADPLLAATDAITDLCTE